jgi:hypothetical protein
MSPGMFMGNPRAGGAMGGRGGRGSAPTHQGSGGMGGLSRGRGGLGMNARGGPPLPTGPAPPEGMAQNGFAGGGMNPMMSNMMAMGGRGGRGAPPPLAGQSGGGAPPGPSRGGVGMGGGGMGGGGMGGGGMGGGGNQNDVPQMNPRILAAMLAAKGMRVPDGLLASANASANVSSGPPSQRALYSYCVCMA